MKIFVLFASVLCIAQALELPSYITRCSKSDPKLSECLQKSISHAWSTLVKGDKTYHLPPANPLKVTFIYVDIGNTLQGNLTNVLFYGLENAEIKEIQWDITKRRVVTKFLVPQLKISGGYEVTGRIIGLPLEGNGETELLFDNMDCVHSFDYNTVERNGKEYIDIKQTEMPYSTTKFTIFLGNLFHGAKYLGRAMNDVLNENWDSVNNEINPIFGNRIGEAYSQVLQAFFNRVSLDEYFTN